MKASMKCLSRRPNRSLASASILSLYSRSAWPFSSTNAGIARPTRSYQVDSLAEYSSDWTNCSNGTATPREMSAMVGWSPVKKACSPRIASKMAVFSAKSAAASAGTSTFLMKRAKKTVFIACEKPVASK
ncbi:hypothetical protein TYRP_005644 [Tyrophagus putrescentiae]|nr:hypothetical protein TYRP_005644 [Tyrophagus putrescentiae]